MTLPEASLWAFTAFSGLRLVSYFPQIYRVARDLNGASAIAYSTWTLWTGCHVSTGLYAAINLSDSLLAAASMLYALCCVAVIAITAAKRHRLRLRDANMGENPSIAGAVADLELNSTGRQPAGVSRPSA